MLGRASRLDTGRKWISSPLNRLSALVWPPWYVDGPWFCEFLVGTLLKWIYETSLSFFPYRDDHNGPIENKYVVAHFNSLLDWFGEVLKKKFEFSTESFRLRRSSDFHKTSFGDSQVNRLNWTSFSGAKINFKWSEIEIPLFLQQNKIKRQRILEFQLNRQCQNVR